MCMIRYAVLHMHIKQLNSVHKAELSGSFEGTQKLETEFPSNMTSLKIPWEPTIYLKYN